MKLKLRAIPASKIIKEKKKRKKKSNHTNKIFGLRKCVKCLQTKTLPNFDGDSFVCDICVRGGDKRGFADYVQEAIKYEDWRAKYPNIKPCHRCRGLYPPYVTSIENGLVTCANCFLILEEEEKENEQDDK